MRTPHSLSAAVMTVVLLAVTACSGEPADTTQPAAAGSASAESITTPEYLAFRAQPTACGAERPEPAVQLGFDAPTDLGLSGTVEVVLDTSCGDISLSLDADSAPVTVNSFVFLAERGYFDGIALHRVVPGFVIQIGDPTATGAGFPGYRIPDELPPAGFLYTRGTVAMANAGPDTGGSQFFLVLEDINLPPSYTVFGQTTSGFETMDLMTAVPMGPNPGDSQPSRPLETIYINSVEVVGR
jgi:cyclophilin family peptidyl-prolyl cis-trans isomerase